MTFHLCWRKDKNLLTRIRWEIRSMMLKLITVRMLAVVRPQNCLILDGAESGTQYICFSCWWLCWFFFQIESETHWRLWRMDLRRIALQRVGIKTFALAFMVTSQGVQGVICKMVIAVVSLFKLRIWKKWENYIRS